MRYLLDVNALLALGFSGHEFHERVARWISAERPSIATCAITELGFVRVLSQARLYGISVGDARTFLMRLRAESTLECTFLVDDQDISGIPGWVKSPTQITDGHLVQLARAHKAVLATLDKKIPGSFLIPERSDRSRP